MQKAAALIVAVASFQAAISAAHAEPRLSVVVTDSCVQTAWPPAKGEKFVGPFAALLGPVILPGLFERGMSFLTGKLRNAASDAQTVLTAQTTGYFQEADLEEGVFKASRDTKCVIVAYAEMATTNETPELARFGPSGQSSLKSHGLRFAADPLFYYEGIIAFSDDRENFKIKTAHLDYAGELKNGKGKAGARELAMTLLFERGDGVPVAQAKIPFGAVNAGARMNHEALGITDIETIAEADFDNHASPEFETNWMPVLRASESSLRQLADYCDANGGCPRLDQADARKRIRGAPFTLTVQISESSRKSDILNFLADAAEVGAPAAASQLTAATLGRELYNPADPATATRRAAAAEACRKWKEANSIYRNAVADGMKKAVTMQEEGKDYALTEDAKILETQTVMRIKLDALKKSFAAADEPGGLGPAASLACTLGLF